MIRNKRSCHRLNDKLRVPHLKSAYNERHCEECSLRQSNPEKLKTPWIAAPSKKRWARNDKQISESLPL